MIARDEAASPADRARMWLDVSAIRQDRLGDARGALDAAAAALREAPAHPEARRRVEDLAIRARAYAELQALLAQAADALSGQAAEERSLRMRAAQLAEEELGSHEQAAVQLRRVREIDPRDPDALAGLTRLALAGERWGEACDLLADRERLEPPPAEHAALATQLGDLLLERLHDPVAAAAAYRRAIAFVPREQSARLLARTAHALDAAQDREGLLEVLADLASHPNLPPGLELPVPPPPVDPVDRLEEARARLSRDPNDVAAAAEMEQLAVELDRPADLAWALEQRLSAALFDSEVAFRIAELRRLRLGDSAGALRLLAELAAADPDHPGMRQSILQMAREPGVQGRDALALVDQVLASPQDVETRLTVREDRLAGEQDPAERAHLQGEIRTLIEVDLADPSRALDAARGAFAAGGREREEALADIPRLAEKSGRLDVLADVYAAAAEATSGGAVSDFLRLSARTRDRTDDVAAQLAAWRAVVANQPGDVEALESLDRILSRERRVEELAPVLADLAETRRGDPARRLEVLLRRAVLLEGAEDSQASVDAFAAVLEEFPQEGAALSGLARALSRPGSSEAAGRLLEKVHRASGDRDQLADLIELRLDGMPPEERPGALAELSDLREAGGRLVAAFEARARQYALERGEPAREPGLRATLCRLADAAGVEDRLAEVLSASVEQGLPEEAAVDALAVLAGVHRSRQAWAPLVAALRDRARLVRDFRVRRDLWTEVAEVAGDRLGDAEGAREAWTEVASLLEQEGEEAVARPGGEAEAAEARVLAARIQRDRLREGGRAIQSFRAALASVPDHPGALAGVQELSRDPELLAAHASFFADFLAAALAAAEASGKDAEADDLRTRLASLREEQLQDRAGALALLDVVLARHPEHAEALAQVERAMAHDPERAGAILERVYLATGRNEQLAALLTERLPRLGASGGPVALRLGALLEGPLGRPEEAPHFYEEARRLDPALAPRALAALERLYRKLERWGELAHALEALAEAETRQDERTGLLFVLAQLFEERLASPGRAAEVYGRILETQPDHPASAGPLPASPRPPRRPSPSCRFASGERWRAGTRRIGARSMRFAGSSRPTATWSGWPTPCGGCSRSSPDPSGPCGSSAPRRSSPAGTRTRCAEEGRRALALGPASDAELDRLAAIFRAAGRPTTAPACSRRGPAASVRARRPPTPGGPPPPTGGPEGGPWRPRQRSRRPSPAIREAGPPSTRFARCTPTRATGEPGPGSPSSTSRASPTPRAAPCSSRSWPRCSRPAPTIPPGPGMPGGGPSRRGRPRSGRSPPWSGSPRNTAIRARWFPSSSRRRRRPTARGGPACSSGWRWRAASGAANRSPAPRPCVARSRPIPDASTDSRPGTIPFPRSSAPACSPGAPRPSTRTARRAGRSASSRRPIGSTRAPPRSATRWSAATARAGTRSGSPTSCASGPPWQPSPRSGSGRSSSWATSSTGSSTAPPKPRPPSGRPSQSASSREPPPDFTSGWPGCGRRIRATRPRRRPTTSRCSRTSRGTWTPSAPWPTSARARATAPASRRCSWPRPGTSTIPGAPRPRSWRRPGSSSWRGTPARRRAPSTRRRSRGSPTTSRPPSPSPRPWRPAVTSPAWPACSMAPSPASPTATPGSCSATSAASAWPGSTSATRPAPSTPTGRPASSTRARCPR